MKEITYEQIIGTLVFKIPRIGNIILLLEDKIYVILLLNLALIIYINTRRVEEKKKTVQNNAKQKNIKQYINIQTNIDKYIFYDII